MHHRFRIASHPPDLKNQGWSDRGPSLCNACAGSFSFSFFPGATALTLPRLRHAQVSTLTQSLQHACPHALKAVGSKPPCVIHLPMKLFNQHTATHRQAGRCSQTVESRHRDPSVCLCPGTWCGAAASLSHALMSSRSRGQGAVPHQASATPPQIGYQNTATKFWWFALANVLIDNCGAALGMFVACLFNDIAVALVRTTLVLLRVVNHPLY